MEEFIKPKTEYAYDREYIQELINVNLQKDLCDDEEICSHCHGTGLVITNNPYGLEGDPDKSCGYFPYKHQSITFCPYCYNGIVHRCKLCGEIMPKGVLKHRCDKQREVDRLAAEEKEVRLLEKATEYPPEALSDFVMCYYDGYPHNEGYIMEWDEFFDWWDSECEGEMERPQYVWGTTKRDMSMDADSLIEEATDDLYEDAEDRISDAERKKLQDFLNEWCANCGVGFTYDYTTKCKIKIPWELYKKS